MAKRKSKYYYVYRSSITGKFISKEAYDAADSGTTQRTRRLRKSNDD
jgi:hypothetical protein